MTKVPPRSGGGRPGRLRRLAPRALRLIALVLFVAALPAEAARAEAESDSLKIGVLATLEGAFESLGQDALRGHTLAMEEFRERAGGRAIETIVESTDGTPDSAIAKARTLIENGASVIIGPLAGIESIAIRDFARSVPEVTIVNGASAAQDATLRAPAENFFRFNPDSMQWIAGLGRHAYDLKGIRTVITVAEDFSLPYTQLMGFMLDFCALGGEVLAQHWLSSGASDATRIAESVAGVETDALLLALAPHVTESFLEAYGNAGGTASIVASSTTLSGKLLMAGEPVRSLLKGAISALPVSESDDNAVWTAMRQRYRERFPEAGPAPGLFALAYYVNTKALLLAFEETGGIPGEGSPPPARGACRAPLRDAAGRSGLARREPPCRHQQLRRRGDRDSRRLAGAEHGSGGARGRPGAGAGARRVPLPRAAEPGQRALSRTHTAQGRGPAGAGGDRSAARSAGDRTHTADTGD